MKAAIFTLIFCGQLLDIISTVIALRINKDLSEGNGLTKNLYLLTGMKILFSILMYFVAAYLGMPMGLILAMVLFAIGLVLAVHNLLMI
jgi:hypothetical protein